MKKKIFLSLLLIISLFIITGCAGDNGELSKDGRKIEKFYDLKYIGNINYKEEKKIS